MTASVDDRPVAVEVTRLDEDEEAQYALVSFPQSTWLGQSVTVDVSYLLLGGGALIRLSSPSFCSGAMTAAWPVTS